MPRAKQTKAKSVPADVPTSDDAVPAVVPEPTNYALAGFGFVFVVGIVGRQVLVCRRSRATR
jgi:hypothetical protein